MRSRALTEDDGNQMVAARGMTPGHLGEVKTEVIGALNRPGFRGGSNL
jgi:hypothetical protein